MEKKSEILLALESFANSNRKEELRKEALTKLALSAMDRKTLSKEIQKTQKELSIVRKESQESNAVLSDAQARADRASTALKELSHKLVQLNQISNAMDLSGADSISPLGNDIAYIIDGRRMHVDHSDVNDVKVRPWKEHLKSKEQEAIEENTEMDLDDFFGSDAFDLAKEAKMERQVITKIAKKFR